LQPRLRLGSSGAGALLRGLGSRRSRRHHLLARHEGREAVMRRAMVMDGFGYEDEGTRSRWLKIGGGALAGVVLLAAGFGIGRLSAPAAAGGQQAKVSGQSGPGPWRVENGVPVGYAHTQEGAVAAATGYLVI